MRIRENVKCKLTSPKYEILRGRSEASHFKVELWQEDVPVYLPAASSYMFTMDLLVRLEDYTSGRARASILALCAILPANYG